jgi:uncharacterized protein (UPF0335 family)
MTNVVPLHSESIAHDHLRVFVERIERMHEERKSIADDIKEIYAEAKGNGFDVAALKHVIKLRAKDPADLAEFEAIVDLYLTALGGSHVHSREEA